jgi:hypothetical protein
MKLFVVLVAVMVVMQNFAFAQTPSVPVPQAQTAIPKTVINNLYKQCRVTPITRFTPGALESYCACTAAALQGTFNVTEFNELQKQSTQRIGNKIFERYVSDVIVPCLTDPIDEIEYYYCVVDRTNDPRIPNIPQFCTCMSKRLAKYVGDFGVSNIMLTLGMRESVTSPVDALWASRDFSSARTRARNECLSGG